jgi:hypothetical protein
MLKDHNEQYHHYITLACEYHPEAEYEVVRVLELMLEQKQPLNLVQKLLMQKIQEDQPWRPSHRRSDSWIRRHS